MPAPTVDWKGDDGPAAQLVELVAAAREPGLMVVAFKRPAAGAPCPWPELQRWIRTRAVTVAEIATRLAGGALEVALTSDLVVLRPGALLELPATSQPLPAGMIWAAGRAGRRALARCLLDDGELGPAEALELGLAQQLIGEDEAMPLAGGCSLAALTAARDLMAARAGASAALCLERATFQMLFACGDPGEGARAFLERRQPAFGDATDEDRG
jgi:enoyl-CoA hydratase/carnithine racemase